jgi:hypothetical protein
MMMILMRTNRDVGDSLYSLVVVVVRILRDKGRKREKERERERERERKRKRGCVRLQTVNAKFNCFCTITAAG